MIGWKRLRRRTHANRREVPKRHVRQGKINFRRSDPRWFQRLSGKGGLRYMWSRRLGWGKKKRYEGG